MNPLRLINSGAPTGTPTIRPQVLLAAIALLSALPASAADKAYRYYQFKTTKLVGNGSNLMLAEFDFYHGGTKLNIRNKTGVGTSIACDASAGDADPNGVEGPNKLLDGDLSTKLFRGRGLDAGNEVIFDFGATLPHPVIDSYTFTTATDGASYIRTPQTWVLYGSEDKVTWTPVDSRVDAVTVLENSVTYGPFEVPEVVAPLINTFSTPAAIVLNNTPVTFTYNTQFSTTRNVYAGATTIPLAAESGTFTVTPPINGPANPYTFVATKEGAADAVKTALVRTVIGGPSTYRYVRFKITKRRGGDGDSTVQLAEFEFYNTAVSAAKIPVSGGVTNPGGNSPGAETPDKLVDGITTEGGNKWLDFNNAAVVFDFGSQQTFNKYAFFTGGDAADRDPVQWTMEGTNDSMDDPALVRWNLIENVNFDYDTPLARNTTTTPLPLPGPSLAPVIEYFNADSLTLITGQSATLSWSTQATSSVEIAPAPGAGQPLFGSVTVTPTLSTTYTLTANPLAGGVNTPITRTITVNVVADPGKTEITYDDFSEAGVELVKVGATTITPPTDTSPNRLRLTPDTQGQHGAAWFLNKLKGINGFEANFGLSMNSVPNGYAPADGIAFVIHNSPARNSELGNGESGVSQNALNITFTSFGFDPVAASKIQVTMGGLAYATTAAYNVPGVQLYGLPGFPYTLGTKTTDPAYRIRVVYVPGDLDVYLDGVAVLQNVPVSLDGSAADEDGYSYFGFTARTGGNTQFNDITDWDVKFGDFTSSPPFGSVKTVFKHAEGSPKPTAVDLVWNANSVSEYQVLSSPNLIDWTPVKNVTDANGPIANSETGIIIGIDGQIGASAPVSAESGDKLFYRVSSTPVGGP